MNKYKNLLLKIANKYSIFQGDNESTDEWKVRIIYSVCGLMAYTSLWDETSEGSISITHLEYRIRSIYDSYLELYSEISRYFPYEKEALEKEITEIFIKSGMIYHRPNRVSPSKKCCSFVDDVCFKRGIGVDNIKCMSGIGFYSVGEEDNNSIDVQEMFQLNTQNLSDYWNDLITKAYWSVSDEFNSDTEFLKMKQPFTKGYWTNKPYRTEQVSLLRTGMKGYQLYYLYRYNDNLFEVSPLSAWQSSWQISKHQYRTIACACLHFYNSLPAIDYSVDGKLVHLHMNYLLPPQELYWIKLYSWPEKCNVLPSDFYRKCSLKVFNAFKKVLSEKGYIFNER